MNSFSGARTTVSVRGNMLVAWFADATPAVLWRWPPGDAAAGFALRQENGRTELVKHDTTGEPAVVAVFTSEERAAKALEKLSIALRRQKYRPYSSGEAPRTRSNPWKWLTLLMLVVLVMWFIIHVIFSAMSLASSEPLPGLDAVNAARAAGQLPGPGSKQPAAAVRPPSPGTPVDADALFR